MPDGADPACPPLPSLDDDWWTGEQCAQHLGIKLATWRYYVRARLPEGNPAPEADRYFGRTPVWRPAGVRGWELSRPGRGWWRRG